MQNNSTIPQIFYRARSAAQVLDISLSHFYRLVAEGKIQQGHAISVGVRVWRSEDITRSAEKMWEVT